MGDNVAVLVYHYNDSLQNETANQRSDFYGFTTPLNNIFNGTQHNVEADPENSLYYPFVNLVNQINPDSCDFEVNVEANYDEVNSLTSINVLINKTVAANADNLRLYVAVTQSGIPVNWLGMSEVNFITQKFLPAEGTPLTFEDNTFSFNTSDSYPGTLELAQNCEIVAFIQNTQTREILQASSVPLVYPTTQLDAAIKKIISPRGEFCNDEVPVEILVKNNGTETLHSLHFDYSVNNGTLSTFDWEGNIPFGENAKIVLPSISGNFQTQNIIDITCTAPNGGTDENPGDNGKIQMFFKAKPDTPYSAISIQLKTDSYPEETSWLLTNHQGDTISTGDSYTLANHLYQDTVYVDTQDCYNFQIFDSYGDGICCNDGEGYFKLEDVRGNEITGGGEFTFTDYKGVDLNDAKTLIALFTADTLQFNYENDSVHFRNLSFGGGTPFWEFEGGVPSTSEEENPVVFYADSGMFKVSLTIEKEGITDQLELDNYITIGAPNGIVDNFLHKKLVCLNPFTNFALIKFISDVDGRLDIRIVDALGKTVVHQERSYKPGENNFKINTNFLNKGEYLIVLKTENGIYTRKVLKNR